MPGVKGAGGPPPKRSDQRRRANPTAVEERMGGATSAARGELVIPDPDPEWHPVALRWFESLATSGQSAFYESSDWALAAIMAETISRELGPQPLVVGTGKDARIELVVQPLKGATIAAFLKGCTALMVSEGDRRRAALELQLRRLEPEQAAPAAVTDMRSWRSSMQA